MSIIFFYFTKKFFEAFVIGIIIRIAVAILLRSDVSFRGLIVTGTVSGLIYISVLYYIISNSVIPVYGGFI